MGQVVALEQASRTQALQTRAIIRLTLSLLGGVLIINAYIVDSLTDPALGIGDLLAMVGAILLAIPLMHHAIKDIVAGEVHIMGLAALAVFAAFALGDYKTAGVVAFFMVVSELVQHRTALGARLSIESLIRLSPTRARVILKDGTEEEREAHRLRPGDRIRVRPGDNIAADGVVRAGGGTVNQAPITGESMPVDKEPGDQVFAGSHNETGTLEVEVTRAGKDTTLGRVKDLILQAESTRIAIVRIIDRYASYYTPFILMLALIVYFFTMDPRRSIALLVVGCPCALILATPTAMVAAISAAARLGILVKNVNVFEVASRLNAVVFDKTGTLTTGHLSVVRLSPGPRVDAETLLRVASSVEQYSTHPVARAVMAVAKEAQIAPDEASDFREVPGKGVSGRANGAEVLVGREAWLRESGVTMASLTPSTLKEAEGFSTLYVAKGGRCIGWIGLEDATRPQAREAAEQLQSLGVKRLVMLTGDRPTIAEKVARQLGASEFKAECLPGEKLQLVDEMKRVGYRVAVVGDGVNDAPALAAGDIGIALGAAGSDVALNSAEVALMNNDLLRLPFLIRLSRRARAVIYQNLLFGAAFVVLGIVLSASGVLTPIVAAVAHNVGSLIVIFNSARLVRSGEEFTPHAELVAQAEPQPA